VCNETERNDVTFIGMAKFDESRVFIAKSRRRVMTKEILKSSQVKSTLFPLPSGSIGNSVSRRTLNL
jgi:hypothetical protein